MLKLSKETLMWIALIGVTGTIVGAGLSVRHVSGGEILYVASIAVAVLAIFCIIVKVVFLDEDAPLRRRDPQPPEPLEIPDPRRNRRALKRTRAARRR